MKRLLFISMMLTVFFQFAPAQNVQEKDKLDIAKDTLQIKEVVVKASRPISKLNDEGFVTDVKGSILQKLGSAKDVLGMLPGVLNNNGNIEVFGKGTPVFYLNGRMVRNMVEIDQLKSDQIDKIVVVTSPGARYGSSVSSVIKITTVGQPGDGFSLDNQSTIGYREKFYGKEDLALNYRVGGLDAFAICEYDNDRIKTVSHHVQNSWLASHHQQVIKMNSTAKSQLLEGKWGFDYSFSKNHSLGAFYQVSYKPVKVPSAIQTNSYTDDLLGDSYDIDKRVRSRDLMHLVDGYYNGVFGKLRIEAVLDFMWKHTHETQDVTENTAENQMQDFAIHDAGKAKLAAGEVHLSHPFLSGKLNFGVEYSKSIREESSYNEQIIIDDEKDRIEESNMALYLETMQRIGKTTIRLGGRYEHVNSAYYQAGVKEKEGSHVYDKLFPTFSLSLPVGSAMLQLGYSKQCYRPLYSQLSGTIHYVNNYLYQSGNPLLRTSYSDNISLNFKYRWLAVMASYKIVDDQIITSCIYYDDAKTIALLKKDNAPYKLSNLQVMASVAPGFIWNCYYPVLACGIVSQFYKVDYLDGVKRMNAPLAIVKFNNMLKLPDAYMMMVNFNWRSDGNSENIKLKSTWQMNVSLSKDFSKHWNVKLVGNDLFNTASKSRFKLYSGMSDVYSEKQSCMRYVECCIRYKLNVAKSKYLGKGAGNKERSRL